MSSGRDVWLERIGEEAAMANPSTRQVGGTHYQPSEGGVGHWDYCDFQNVPYLESASTKYLSRWRNKNGIQDLEKSLHYLEKRIFNFRNHTGVLIGSRKNGPMFDQFLKTSHIHHPEALIIDTILHWKSLRHLMLAREALIGLIEEQQCGATAAYVNQG